MRYIPCVLALLVLVWPAVAQTPAMPEDAGEVDRFYVHTIEIGELKLKSLVVDTGATISVLSPEDLGRILDKKFVRTTELRLADGQIIQSPVYLVARVYVGNCELLNVRFVSLPGSTGAIGVQAMEQLMPITFSNDDTEVTCQRPRG